jgi:uncharacterized protein (TIGR02145 family)
MGGQVQSASMPIGVRGICPEAWHIPSDSEWTILVNFVSKESVVGAGKALKAVSGWTAASSTTSGAGSDLYGFRSLPAGYRHISGSDQRLGNMTFYWSSTQFDAVNAWNRQMSSTATTVTRRYDDKATGFAVRCVRD